MPRSRGSKNVPAEFVADHDARELWLAAHRHLHAQGTWQDTDGPLLEAYVRNIVTARRARAAAEGDPFVAGSKGQPVAHPGLKVAAEAERDAQRYASELLLTPAARRRHNLKTTGGGDDGLAGVLGIVEAGGGGGGSFA